MSLNTLRILVADDYAPHLYALSRTLESIGAKVLTASTGSEVLKLAVQHPDAILLDLNMPEVDGWEVCRRLKADPTTSQIAVVLFTATDQRIASHALASGVGASAMLFYPIEKEHLFCVIEGSVAKQSHAGTNVPPTQ